MKNAVVSLTLLLLAVIVFIVLPAVIDAQPAAEEPKHQITIGLEDAHIAAILAQNQPGTEMVDGAQVRQNNPETGKPFTDVEWVERWLCKYCDQQLERVEKPQAIKAEMDKYVRSASAKVIRKTAVIEEPPQPVVPE